MDLFEVNHNQQPQQRPLAERMRPQRFEDFVGQTKLRPAEKSLLHQLDTGQILPNLILWGPPGTGKTTFARLLSTRADCEFVEVSAVDTGAKKLKEIGQSCRDQKLQFARHTILFIDEVHRLNKAVQDVLLPFTERGDFSLVGATTENPSYELNSALLSRSRVLVFEQHSLSDLTALLEKGLLESGLQLKEVLADEVVEVVAQMCHGDARKLFNLVEVIAQSYHQSKVSESPLNWPLTKDGLDEILEATPLYYDKRGDKHHDTISAFIKSIRGSDPDAGLYYLARMLASGENPVFIARRLVVLASEDVGNADPRALTMATSGLQAVTLVGLPEAAINLAQVVTYLASAPKSNASYKAFRQAEQLVKDTGPLEIPKSLRSARTKLSRQLGHGEGYRYSHQGATGYLEQQFLPEQIKDEVLYRPVDRGFEKNIRQYLQWMRSERGED